MQFLKEENALRQENLRELNWLTGGNDNGGLKQNMTELSWGRCMLCLSLKHLHSPRYFLIWALLIPVQALPGILNHVKEGKVVQGIRGHSVKLSYDQCYTVPIIDFMYLKNPLCFWMHSQILSHVVVLVVGPQVIYISPLIFFGMEHAHYLILSVYQIATSGNLDFRHRVTVGLHCGWSYSLLLFAFPSGNRLLKLQNSFLASHI